MKKALAVFAALFIGLLAALAPTAAYAVEGEETTVQPIVISEELQDAEGEVPAVEEEPALTEDEDVVIDDTEGEQAPAEETLEEEAPPVDEEGEGEAPVDDVIVVTLEAPTKVAGECRVPMAPLNAVKVDVRTPGAVQYFVNGIGVNTTDGFIQVYDYQVTISAVVFQGYAIEGAPEGFIEWPPFEFPYKECPSDIVFPDFGVDVPPMDDDAVIVTPVVAPDAPVTPDVVTAGVSTPVIAAHPKQLAETGVEDAAVQFWIALAVIATAGGVSTLVYTLRRRNVD